MHLDNYLYRMEEILLHHHLVHRIKLNEWRHYSVIVIFQYEDQEIYFVVVINHELIDEVHHRNI
jgi:hypothetical protein